MTKSPTVWLNNEIKFIIAIAVFVTSIVLAYGSLVTRSAVTDEKINNIELNHLPHIDTSLNEINTKLDDYNKQLVEIQKSVVELNTIFKAYDIKIQK